MHGIIQAEIIEIPVQIGVRILFYHPGKTGIVHLDHPGKFFSRYVGGQIQVIPFDNIIQLAENHLIHLGFLFVAVGCFRFCLPGLRERLVFRHSLGISLQAVHLRLHGHLLVDALHQYLVLTLDFAVLHPHTPQEKQ